MSIGKFGSRDEPRSRDTAAAPSVGKLTEIKGRVTAEEDVLFYGALEGFVEAPAHKVVVGPTAHVTGDVWAREVVVYGTVDGNLEAAERIQILRQAKVTGDARTCRILIEDGAYFQGSIDIVAEGNPAPKRRPEKPPVILEGPSFLAVGE